MVEHMWFVNTGMRARKIPKHTVVIFNTATDTDLCLSLRLFLSSDWHCLPRGSGDQDRERDLRLKMVQRKK